MCVFEQDVLVNKVRERGPPPPPSLLLLLPVACLELGAQGGRRRSVPYTLSRKSEAKGKIKQSLLSCLQLLRSGGRILCLGTYSSRVSFVAFGQVNVSSFLLLISRAHASNDELTRRKEKAKRSP